MDGDEEKQWRKERERCDERKEDEYFLITTKKNWPESEQAQ